MKPPAAAERRAMKRNMPGIVRDRTADQESVPAPG